MSTREERGRAIAETQKLTRKGKVWLVPSQSGDGGKYTVCADEAEPFCSCKDHEEGGFICKHIHAVRFTMTKTETNADGTTTVTTVTVNAERKTYRQSWPEYNAAQNNEKDHFQDFLADLTRLIPQPPAKGGVKGGRPAVRISDAAFSVVFKVYCAMSARRFMCDLRDAHERGCTQSLICHNSVLKQMENPELTPILKALVEASALPLRAIETKFAVDSTGFSSTKYGSWYDKKWGVTRDEAVWTKAHFMTGVKTNVVCSVNIDHQDAADSPQFAPLVHKTAAQGFTLDEVSADKAYPSAANFEAVETHGGQFFPMFKSNATGAVGGSYEKAFHWFQFKKEEYLIHYHQRSNVESTVSMIKRKFGHAVFSKSDVAMRNETYAKFVCHNIAVLIQEMYVLGIDPTFGKRERDSLTTNLTGCLQTATI